MTSSIVIVLHGPADAAYAAELAGALSPHLAFPVALSLGAERPTQYGAGAVCVVLWTQDAASRALAGEIARAMHGAVSSALVCRLGQAPLPADFSANACIQVHQQAGAQDVATPLRNAIERRLQEWEERSAGPRRSARPSLDAAVAQASSASGGRRMVVRSAWGLAATMAVVGVAAPVVSDRAGAANIPPDQGAAPNEATVVSVAANATTAAPAVDAAGDVIEAAVAPVSYPAPDPLVEALAAQTAPEPVAAMTQEQAVMADEPELVLAAAALPELDPKTVEMIAAMAAGADMGDWKIEAVAPLTSVRHEKPGAAPEAPAKPVSGA